jgi:hypothetical protein
LLAKAVRAGSLDKEWSMVSNSTLDPETGKKYFSPCTLVNLEALLDRHLKSETVGN